MGTYTSKSANGDVVLFNPLPEAEYMYGCVPTAVGMLLGYLTGEVFALICFSLVSAGSFQLREDPLTFPVSVVKW